MDNKYHMMMLMVVLESRQPAVPVCHLRPQEEVSWLDQQVARKKIINISKGCFLDTLLASYLNLFEIGGSMAKLQF